MPATQREWIKRLEREGLIDGEIATCDMVRLELLYSAQSASEFKALSGDLEALPDCPIGKQQWSRALGVYEQLADKAGLHHRAVKHADPLIAAAAEAAGPTPPRQLISSITTDAFVLACVPLIGVASVMPAVDV